MAQRASLRDYRVLETGRRRANRLVLTELAAAKAISPFRVEYLDAERLLPVLVRKAA